LGQNASITFSEIVPNLLQKESEMVAGALKIIGDPKKIITGYAQFNEKKI
jgi:hypothetical protein